jgi:hypothetical protein
MIDALKKPIRVLRNKTGKDGQETGPDMDEI